MEDDYVTKDEILKKFFGKTKTVLCRESEKNTCTNQCSYWCYDKEHFVCKKHVSIHYCGHRCKQLICTNEAFVCGLTGIEQEREFTYHCSLKKDFFGKRKQAMHIQRRSKSLSSLADQPERILREIRSTLELLLCSKERTYEYKKHTRKIETVFKRAVKKTPVQWAVVNGIVIGEIEKHMGYLKPLFPESQKYLLDILANGILKYFFVIKSIKITSKNISVFTCAVITILKKGLLFKNFEIFPRVVYLTRHTPCTAMMSDILKNVKSSLITNMEKLLREKYLSYCGMPIKQCFFRKEFISGLELGNIIKNDPRVV